jgi:hypothetical protein
MKDKKVLCHSCDNYRTKGQMTTIYCEVPFGKDPIAMEGNICVYCKREWDRL